MNKKKLILFGLPILVLAFITAGIISYYGQVQRDVTVEQAILFMGDNAADVTVIAGESVVSEDLLVESQTSVIVPLSIETVADPDDVGIVHTVNYLLSASGGVGTDSTIYIDASDTDVSTLSDLNSISWDVDVLFGYIAHVDVILETDALVFEYAKVDTPCDNTPYPTGVQNTFGNKGIVDSEAKAWLNSGVPGYCGLPEFDENHRSLAEWKTFRGSEKVIGFEIEVDNWIEDSDSDVKNILINGNSVEVSLKPSNSLEFNVETEFGLLNVGDYTVTTTVTPR